LLSQNDIDIQVDEKYIEKIAKKYFSSIAERENPFIFAPALRRYGDCEGGMLGRPKKDEKKFGLELEEIKKRLPLQPGSEETGTKSLNGRFAQRGGRDIPEVL